MPNEISNALGTSRQFVPKPDATYQGRYRDVSVAQVHPTQSSWTTLADNMSKLNNALQSYAVSHEKYLDSTGLDKAQDLIKSKSPEDIEKLNLIDGAQTEGLLDVGSNPYFKAYAEKLRGNFLGARLKQNYDDEYANSPAKSADDELKRYNEYVQNYRKSLLEKAPPSNLEAFDRGFYENSLTNATNLVGAYNKKKNEEYVVNTMADITNESGELINNASTLLNQDNHSFTDKVKEIFNAGRLMGLPAQYREKLVVDFTKRLVETGAIPFDRLKMMMDNVTIQTDMAGTEKKMSEYVDMNVLEETNLAYNLKYDRQMAEGYIEKYGNTRQYKKFLEDANMIKYTDPKTYRTMMSVAPQVYSRQQQREAEAKADARARLQAINRANGGSGSSGSGSSKKIADTDIINTTISAWLDGETYTPQYGTISNMKFDEPTFVSCVMNELQYLAGIEATTGITKLLAMPQVSSVKKDLLSQVNASMASIHYDSSGAVTYDKNVENLIKWFQADPAGASFLYGGETTNEAQVICGLITATGSLENALGYYATWNTKSSEDKRLATKGLQDYFDIEYGVANLRGGDMEEKVIISENPSLMSTWKNLTAILHMRGDSQESAGATAGKIMGQNLFYFRGCVFPKSVLNDLGTGNDTEFFASAIDDLTGWSEHKDSDGNYIDSISYDFDSQTFYYKNGETGQYTIRPLSTMRDVARSLAEQAGAKKSQEYANNTSMTPEDVNDNNINNEGSTPYNAGFGEAKPLKFDLDNLVEDVKGVGNYVYNKIFS